jgi:RND family efflux transporter MFP subunit
MRRSIRFSTSLLALLIAGLGCTDAESARKRAAPTTAPATVSVATVVAAPAQRSVQVVGTLHGDEETTISAKVSGRIVAVMHDVGDRVKPGQPLAQIETRDYELARAQKHLAMRESLSRLGLNELPEGAFDADRIPTVVKARLAAENAEGRFMRGKQLHDQQPPRLSDQEFADLQTARDVAQNEYQVQVLEAQATLAEARARHAELEMADQQLTDTTIRTPGGSTATTQPVPGRQYAVVERMISVGELVSPGTALFRLVDDDPIKLRASVPERFASEMQTGQTVRVRVDAYSDTFTGKITRINPQVDPANRNFRIEALIDNADHRLQSGAFAQASIETRVDSEAIFIPQSAVVSFAGVSRVFVNMDGKATERIVKLGDRRGDDVEIVKGLNAGESIVTTGAAKLVPQTPLIIQP